ncbi:hypothetical protein HMPREF2891_05960 [Actinomyces sp. HMSC065F11]|nr:hypothetical protein HMPREF2891_05960 [Actinomyces sp. HMSC065F11]
MVFDVSGLRTIGEEFLPDVVSVSRDGQELWSGPAALIPAPPEGSTFTPGLVPSQSANVGRILLPWDGPGLRVGDRIKVTGSRLSTVRPPALSGREWRVVSQPPASSFQVLIMAEVKEIAIS